jgi:hypothetical protein
MLLCLAAIHLSSSVPERTLSPADGLSLFKLVDYIVRDSEGWEFIISMVNVGKWKTACAW